MKNINEFVIVWFGEKLTHVIVFDDGTVTPGRCSFTETRKIAFAMVGCSFADFHVTGRAPDHVRFTRTK